MTEETKPTKAQYEEAVIYVFDKASTSADWLTMRAAKAEAGDRWLDVCLLAAKRLEAGASFSEALGMDKPKIHLN